MAHCDRGAHSAARPRQKRSSLRRARAPPPPLPYCSTPRVYYSTVQRPLFPVSGRQKRSRRLHYTLFSIVQLGEADEAQPRVRSIAVIVNIPTRWWWADIRGLFFFFFCQASRIASFISYINQNGTFFFFTRMVKVLEFFIGKFRFFLSFSLSLFVAMKVNCQ